MIRDFRVLLPIAIALLLGLGYYLSMSKPWPPGVVEVQQHLDEHHEKFEQILARMEQDELYVLDWATSSGIVELRLDLGATPISSEEYRSLLEPFGSTIEYVQRREYFDAVGLEPYRVKAKFYHASFVRREVEETTPACHPSFDAIDMGTCHIPSDGEWHIHFYWGF